MSNKSNLFDCILISTELFLVLTIRTFDNDNTLIVFVIMSYDHQKKLITEFGGSVTYKLPTTD